VSPVPFAAPARVSDAHAASSSDSLLESFDLEFDQRLVEEAVLRSLAGKPREREFRAARDPIYEIADADEREERFRSLHAEWFLQLGLGRPVQQALAEQPALVQRTRGCRVIPAQARKDEGADLHVGSRRDADRRPEIDPVRAATPGPEHSWIVLRLRPTTLLEAAHAITLLRRELLHLYDMLDPRFGYEPSLPSSEVGPAYDALLVERYRVLWETYVEGRLVKRGLGAPEARERHLAQFEATFTMLDQNVDASFAFWFDHSEHRHADLVEFARNPGGLPHANRCPVCHFPAPRLLQIDAAGLRSEALQEIRDEHPQWHPADGLCVQCAGLYASRAR
jgi:hypothetical protein